MLMWGYGILLAFEVWPPPLHEGAFHSQLKTSCVLGPFCTLQDEYLLSGLDTGGPNELWCCANIVSEAKTINVLLKKGGTLVNLR